MKLPVMVAVFGLAAAAQGNLAETLNQGMIEEKSGNLAAAVADYQAVAARFDEQRKTAATALFRFAECRRKLHQDDQAKAAYQRVVREFADQSRLEQQSRTVLAKTYNMAAGGSQDREREAAKQRYRSLLLQEIDSVNIQIGAARRQYQLGAATNEEVVATEMKKLRLERELAAFDLGVVPTGIR